MVCVFMCVFSADLKRCMGTSQSPFPGREALGQDRELTKPGYLMNQIKSNAAPVGTHSCYILSFLPHFQRTAVICDSGVGDSMRELNTITKTDVHECIGICQNNDRCNRYGC